MNTKLTELLNQNANAADKEAMQRFFKTRKGEYAEGDVFIGLKVSKLRELIKPFFSIPLDEISLLLQSEIHEYRMAGLIILVKQYRKNRKSNPEPYVYFYLEHIEFVNNWDLVDTSCRDILGDYLLSRPRDVLFELAKKESIWIKRIAVVSTWTFIKNRDYSDALKICGLLLDEKQDILQKAVGWMIREVFKNGGYIEADIFVRENIFSISRKVLSIAAEDLTKDKIEFYRFLKKQSEK